MYSRCMDYIDILKQQVVEVASTVCPKLDDISSDTYTGICSYDLRKLHAVLSDLTDYQQNEWNLRPILELTHCNIFKIWISAADFIIMGKHSPIELNPLPKAEEPWAWLTLNSGRTIYFHISRRIMSGACYLDQEKRLPENLDLSLFRLLPWTEKCERPIAYI